MQFPTQNSRFLYNLPDGPLKASGHPTVNRSFGVEDVRTTEQHRPNARSSFSNLYSELDFMFRHEPGNNNRSDRRATPSGCFSGFQEAFCTSLSVFIMTLCSSIGLRQNLCRWKAKKTQMSRRPIETSEQPTVWTERE
jgi:hypothetical protein